MGRLSTGAMDIGGRIDDATVFEYFEMNVGSGRSAATAHDADNLAFFDDIANLDEQFLVMTIACRETLAMVDLRHLAVTASRAGIDHNPSGDSVDV